MKNLFKLFAVVLCSALCLALSLPLAAEEKINNFEVHLHLKDDTSATVKEYITFTAEHNQIKRGLYRKIPYDAGKYIKVQSLYLDGREHPYNAVDENGGLKINFGTDDFLPLGKHTYAFTYTLENTVSSGAFKDFLLWPVTGVSWTLPIENANITLTVPFVAKVLNNKIKIYDGNIEIEQPSFKQLEENVFFFETSKPLKQGQAFSIYLPMKKGLFQFKWYEMEYMPVLVCILILLYYYIIWYLVGRDPKERNLPQRFSPPEGISAGFASYFLNGKFSSRNLATVLASLLVKKKIKITFHKWKKTECEKLDNGYSDLEEDEARMMMSLPSQFKFDKDGYKYLEKGLLSINYYYEEKIKDYIINNFMYMLFPIIFFIAMLFYFCSRGVVPELLFGVILNFIIPILIGVYTRNIKRVIILVAMLIVFTRVVVSTVLSAKFLLNPNVLAILITCFMTALFAHLVNNLMLNGVILRDELAAFKKYMTIAERGRTALSDPTKAGKIFCDYLPYAYAFGMESKWFKKFKSKIDFHLQDAYDPLISGTAFNFGLLFTVTACLRAYKSSGVGVGAFGGGFGKGGFGGGGGR